MSFRDDRDAARIEKLFGRYVEQQVRDGVAPDPEELCRGSPELLEPLRECIRDYERLGRALNPSRELETGRRLLHYRIVDKLGEGGMGRVYAAEDTKLGRRVALKVLPPEMADDPERLKRFRREARAVAALNHPNIVTLHSIEEADGVHFLTMELVEGKTLDALIAPEGMELGRILEVAEALVDPLVTAHEQGITHRDLKPANIMVSEAVRIKVLDFGLAQLQRPPGGIEGGDLQAQASPASQAVTATRLTQAGRVLGTVPYMSPEQVQGKLVDPRSDIFSLGIVLYEMSTGRRPFQGDSAAAVISATLRDAPRPVRELRADLPQRLGRIIERCLAKDLRQRYPTARDLRDDLAELKREVESGVAVVSAGAAARPVERHTVGREKELLELRAGLDAAAADQGLLLCVAGEPGIGKTTLVDAFLDELGAAGAPCAIARGRCSERLAGTEAYLPFLDVFGSLLKSRADGSVAGLMRRAAPWWYAQVASLAPDDPLDVALADSVRSTTQEQMKRQLAAFLEELSGERPVIFFFDDLHWSDASTIDLLAYLAGRFEALRLLIVATYRPEEMLLAEHPFLRIRPDLIARGRCREVAVGFLSRGEIEDYLALEFPGHGFPADLSELIYDQTEGSPLFMTDLVRYLRDRELIAEGEGGWALSLPVADIRIELPASVRGMIQRKVEHLSAGRAPPGVITPAAASTAAPRGRRSLPAAGRPPGPRSPSARAS